MDADLLPIDLRRRDLLVRAGFDEEAAVEWIRQKNVHTRVYDYANGNICKAPGNKIHNKYMESDYLSKNPSIKADMTELASFAIKEQNELYKQWDVKTCYELEDVYKAVTYKMIGNLGKMHHIYLKAKEKTTMKDFSSLSKRRKRHKKYKVGKPVSVPDKHVKVWVNVIKHGGHLEYEGFGVIEVIKRAKVAPLPKEIKMKLPHQKQMRIM